jgi:hypothetical protein
MALVSAPLSKVLAATGSFNLSKDTIGNFRYIYSQPNYKAEFYSFLTHVFHLYPEDKLQDLISSLVVEEAMDQVIYQQLQSNLSSVKPFLADVTYALPALMKQKKVIAEQTKSLLNSEKAIHGYLEVGSTGRYWDVLEEQLQIDGDVFFVSEKAASYSPLDIVDRGQLFKAGQDISLNNYDAKIAANIQSKSIDLATVYIGFHHCPLHLREEFIGSIRDAMADDATLILRDHDAKNEKMQRMVGLAHDVFNMGTDETWAYNAAELRHFYSLAELEAMMRQYGFKTDGRRLYQPGDPTLNALMAFTKA